MRKQTKLVAVLSAAALLAMGASMTSFAAPTDEICGKYVAQVVEMIEKKGLAE